jgi:alkylation response protein AidB-like acyl-CoA dehydrogenase
MTAQAPTPSRFLELARTLGPGFAERARAHDLEGRFVAENYRELKEQRVLSAGVPVELGGGGASHGELVDMLRELGQFCGSTALALSMHTHLVAAAVWRHRHGQPAEALLRKVASGELVLVSTGAGDWIDSVGRAERVPGGYRVTASKRFASGCPVGDLAISSAPFDDPQRGAEVLHFPVALKAEGVSIREDWDTLGMRATGSHTLELKDVFVPEEAISVRRPRGKWHPSWNVVITVAAPLYMAPYVGVAERAGQLARQAAASRSDDALVLQSLGELENHLFTARMALAQLVDNCGNYDFEPTVERANTGLIAKTLVTNAAQAAVQKALEVVGGGGLYRRHELERLLRDIQGAPFHPLPEKKQRDFTARVALGLPPNP